MRYSDTQSSQHWTRFWLHTGPRDLFVTLWQVVSAAAAPKHSAGYQILSTETESLCQLTSNRPFEFFVGTYGGRCICSGDGEPRKAVPLSISRYLTTCKLSDNNRMATEANIKLPDDLLEQAQRATRNGETADQLAEEAVRREIDRRKKESVRPLLAQIRREAIRNRGGMTDEQVQDYVDQVIHEDHAETRGR